MQAILTALFITLIPIQSVFPLNGVINIEPTNSVNLRYAQADLGDPSVSTQDLNFNGNNVTVQKNANKGLVMTTSTGQASSIFLKEQLKANENQPGFSTYFVMNVYRLNPGPADGYVFVIAADSNSLGASGGGLGYTGIANSVGVEFDFYDNGGESLASSDIFTNGQSSASAGAVFDGGFISQWASKGAGQLVRAYHTWIEYDHAQTRLELRVAISNDEDPSSNRPSRPVDALISRVMNLTQISNYFYAGFTAATGGLAQQMTLKSWYLSNSYIAGGIDPTSSNLVVDSQGPTVPHFTTNQIDNNYEITLGGSEDLETSVAGYQFKVDNQPWAVYETPLMTSTTANYRARAFDEAGNFSLESTMTIYEIIFIAANEIQHRELRTSLDEPFLIDKVFDINGYTYQTWYNNPQLTGEPIQTLPSQNESITLYGNPIANTYTIAYELNLGEVNGVLPTSFNTGSSITLPTPSKIGHTFLGWYYDVNFQTPINPNQLPIESFTAFAKWQINRYTISFISNEGSAVNSIVDDYDSTVNQPNHPTRPGYAFAGWYVDENLQIPFEFNTMPANDLTLYA
ncbi:MAG: InlB B-repeat-containing protein [Bacilli bacterium]